MKQIQVVHLQKLGRNQEPYAIVCSGFSARHIWNTAKKLTSEVKNMEYDEIVNVVKVHGGKQDSWLLVLVKDI